MSVQETSFRAPSGLDRVFNRIYGVFGWAGLGFSYAYLLEVRGRKSGRTYFTLLEVRGRKSGRTYFTPIDLLELNGKRYLVSPRGRTQWVNAEAAGEITLKKGRARQRFGLRALDDNEKPEILKAYLDTFKREVQKYFPVKAGVPPEAFRAVAEQYPGFELTPL